MTLCRLCLLVQSICICLALICNNCIENELFPTGKECGECNGSACFITQYVFHFKQFKGLKAYEMGCLSAPVPFPIGCSKTNSSNVACICKEDYCNNPSLVSTSIIQEVPLRVCGLKEEEQCQSPICQALHNTFDNSTIYRCPVYGYPEENFILASFGFLYMEGRLLFPVGSCLRILALLNYFDSYEYCTFTSISNLTTASQWAKKKIKCRSDYSRSLDHTYECEGPLCFVGANTEGEILKGCIQQSNAQGMRLQPGFYDFYNSHLFICDTDMCNAEIDDYGLEDNSTKPIDPTDDFSCCPRNGTGNQI